MQGERRKTWDRPLTREEVRERMRWMVIILVGMVAIVVAGFSLGILLAILAS